MLSLVAACAHPLVATTPGVLVSDEAVYVALPLANTGRTTVRDLRITDIQPHPTVTPPVEREIQRGGRTVLDLSFPPPATTQAKLPVTVRGSYRAGWQRVAFSVTQTVELLPSAGNAELRTATVVPHVATGGPYPPQRTRREPEHEQTTLPPLPFVPLRPGNGPPETELTAQSATKKTSAFDPPDLTIERVSTVIEAAGVPPDPSGASGRGVVFATFNNSAAVSIDGGPFNLIEPSTVWPGIRKAQVDAAGTRVAGPLWGDQIVHYVASIDRFVWLIQFYPIPRGKGAINMLRLAVASPGDIRTRGANGPGVWTWWDLTSDTFNLDDHWIDFPDLASGDNFLYISMVEADVGGFVARVPLAQLAARSNLGLQYSAPGTGTKMTRNAGPELFWAQALSADRLRIYSLREDSARYSWRDVALRPWSRDFAVTDPDGRPFLYPAGAFRDVQGAVRRYSYNPITNTFVPNELWLAWNAGRDASRPFPSIKIVRIDASTFEVLQQMRITDEAFAYAYPSLATSTGGREVALTCLAGGPERYGQAVVALLTVGTNGLVTNDTLTISTAGSGDASPISRSGDYLTVNEAALDPVFERRNGPIFDAFTYVVRRTRTQPQNEMLHIRFGTQDALKAPPGPPR